MSYNSEIVFLLNNQYQINSVHVGTMFEEESDYETGDTKYESEIDYNLYLISTNVGYLGISTKSVVTKFKTYDRFSRTWGLDKEKETEKTEDFKISNNRFYVDSSTSFISNDVKSSLLGFLSQLKEIGVVFQAHHEDSFHDQIKEISGSSNSNDSIISKLHRLPNVVLQALITTHPENFAGLNTEKLMKLNMALNNTSTPKEFLEKLSFLPESKQENMINFAIKRSKNEVNNLLEDKNATYDDPVFRA